MVLFCWQRFEQTDVCREHRSSCSRREPETNPGIRAGADDYLIKPFSGRELLARISSRLEIARLQTEGEQRFRELAESLEKEVATRTRQLEHHTAELVKQSEDIRALSAQLLHTQNEERRHIARELHDSAGQILTVLNLNLGRMA